LQLGGGEDGYRISHEGPVHCAEGSGEMRSLRKLNEVYQVIIYAIEGSSNVKRDNNDPVAGRVRGPNWSSQYKFPMSRDYWCRMRTIWMRMPERVGPTYVNGRTNAAPA
jgi:hypothetical protein